MAKRQSDTELNHDNWDKEEEKEEPGIFTSVDEKELEKRTIRKAARRSVLTEGSSSSAPAASAFKGFGGFVIKTSAPNFSFGIQETKTSIFDTAKGFGRVQNGCPKEGEQPMDETTGVQCSKKPSQSEDTSPDDIHELEYFRNLRSLNECVIKWLELHFKKNPCCNFCPVFNDYQKYVSELETKYGKKPDDASMPSTTATSSSIFKIPEPSSSKSSEMVFSSKKPDVFQLKSSASDSKVALKERDDSEMLYGANFASNTTNTSTFSSRVRPAQTATSTGSKGTPSSSSSASESKSEEDDSKKNESPFRFGNNRNMIGASESKSEEDDSKKNESPFRFGNNQNMSGKKQDSDQPKPFIFGFSSTHSNVQEVPKGEEPYVPPKNEFRPVSEEDSLYSKRCKLFYKKGEEYVDKGIGTLYLKPLEDRTQLLMRADTNLGNILLNIGLSSSLPMQRTGKNNVLIVCVPNPPLDVKADPKEAIPLLLRVKTSEDADELLDMLNKYKS